MESEDPIPSALHFWYVIPTFLSIFATMLCEYTVLPIAVKRNTMKLSDPDHIIL